MFVNELGPYLLPEGLVLVRFFEGGQRKEDKG